MTRGVQSCTVKVKNVLIMYIIMAAVRTVNLCVVLNRNL